MFKDISIDELMKQDNIVKIDVRSPSEFNEATIPGSINIPFFDDEERAEVGTLYKQVSQQAAKDRGLEIISSKLPEFVKQFTSINGDKAIFCWRGGMRSKTTATVLDLMGVEAFRLDGGYRAYRNWVVEKLESFPMKQELLVLDGMTGTGKTAILHSLQKDGLAAIDLEGRANHRGSIFGQIGLDPHNQKTFDSLLLQDLISLQHSPYVMIEGESRRIGKVMLPEFLLDKKEQGFQVYIELPIEERIKHILESYQPWDHKQECIEAFNIIKKRIHTPIAKQIEKDLQAENFTSAVELLLVYYYDPKYQHSITQTQSNHKKTVKAKTIEEATTIIKDFLRTAYYSV